ncbi:hypothetical protein AX14_001393 [Amanita brunnescens Koide BX004]|nr:hypothetical protein AX14_001393 [Amanita brunnescens Koide BX004]
MPTYPHSYCYADSSYDAAMRDYSPMDGEDEAQDAPYCFASESSRSTFFMISAERGRWKTDPMPFKFHSQPHVWDKRETPASDAPDSALPGLDTDRDSSLGPPPSSPLPPSSPPLSPVSPPSSPLPFSSPLSSPFSSPLMGQLPLAEDPGPSEMIPVHEADQPERPDLDSSPVLDPPPKPKIDVTVKSVLGPRENRADETKLGPVSRGAKRKLGDGKKRKEDHPGPESSRKKRRVEGGKKRPNPKEGGQPSARKADDAKDSSAKRAEDPCPPAISPDGPPQDALDDEILGMLIECMAVSRASSLPASSLYKSVMQSRPALKAQKSDKDWIAVFLRVLEGGVAGRGSGIFGKVESSGKDARDRPLEPQWFYVPEMDEDQERATLIRSMMPRPGKRNETKKYKQYYYRPLDKISRWDPEDSL